MKPNMPGLALLAVALLLPAIPCAAADWPALGGGPLRTNYNPAETTLTRENLPQLVEKWSFQTGKIISATPAVATVEVAGEGGVPLVFISSWDGNVYALRLADGSELWRFVTADQPGASYPNTATAHVEDVGGTTTVFVSGGETMYSLDAATGTENWHFEAGTGCADPPGLCSFDGERNEIETAVVLANGMVMFGMDVNDQETGKGGFFAVDAADGRLAWYFDLETGATCTPDPADNIRSFDGYHTEGELDLPAGFLSTRAGCDFDRSVTGCGNVWSAAAVDQGRGLVYFGSSNCDTDSDPATPKPGPTMPLYDEALVALNFDGTPAWTWRPREVDNLDLAFGASPNLFTINFDGGDREVVGIGGKDGTYYVIDRDGVNESTGVAWDDADPSALPYWATNLVPGGYAGGMTASPAIDEDRRLVYAATAPGLDILNPQQPTVHAINMDNGSVTWQNTGERGGYADANFGPVSAVPGLVMVGTVFTNVLRFYDADSGERLATRYLGSSVASSAVVSGGTLVIGHGLGERSANTSSASTIVANVPSKVFAFCAAGTPGCAGLWSGRKLSLKDFDSSPDKRKLLVLSKDEELVVPVAGQPQDPLTGGAELRLYNPSTAEQQVFSLPASGWKGLGKPAGSKGYRYKDSQQVNGACKSVKLVVGRVFKALCKGATINFTLNEAGQGSLAVTLTTGGGSDPFVCALWGGTLRVDQGTGVNGKGKFLAINSARPAVCP